MDDNIAIKVDHVSKRFKLPHQRPNSVKSLLTGLLKDKGKIEEQQALHDISFEVKRGEFFGIVGRNGSGKSTLLKTLAGIYQPTAGSVTKQGRLVPFIELGVGFNPELTGRENVYMNGAMLGFTVKEIDEMYDDIVTFAELDRFMDQKLKNYSSGMQVRLAFSVATRAKAEILLIDEVLAVGDADFQRKCYDYFKSLKKNKITVVFVSHDMSAVREFCDRAILIDKSRLTVSGTPEEVSKEYSLLFIDNEDSNPSVDNKRWGTGAAQYDQVKVVSAGNKLKIQATLSVKQGPIDNMLYGIHIAGADGAEITATNNRLIQAADIKKLQAGAKVEIDWELLNVFSDGKYFITLTLVDGAQTPLDWFGDAATFSVKRVERSTTAVLPPISVKYKVEET